MGLNFYDYHDFQKNQGGYRLMKNTVPSTILTIQALSKYLRAGLIAASMVVAVFSKI